MSVSYLGGAVSLILMAGDRPVPRRTVLAGLGTTMVIGVSAAQDDGPEPYTRTVNGVSLTFHDCSRVTVDVDEAEFVRLPNEVEVSVLFDDGTGLARTSLSAYDITFPHEFVANCPEVLADLGAVEGTSAIVDSVSVFRDGDLVFGDINIIRESPSYDCDSLIDEPVDQYVLDQFCD